MSPHATLRTGRGRVMVASSCRARGLVTASDTVTFAERAHDVDDEWE